MGLMIEVKAVPQAGKVGFALDKSGKLKCFLKSPAEDGKANQELIKNIAKALGIAQSNVELMSGHTSRNKRVYIALDITFAQLLALLGIEEQQKLF